MGGWDVPPPEGSERFTRAAAEALRGGVRRGGGRAGARLGLWPGRGGAGRRAPRAEVTAVDFAAGPLERAWDLAEDEALEIEWLEQDGLDLLLGNSWFDRSLSGFGVIWSRDVPAAVRELFRVTRPGGTVGFTTWSTPRLRRRGLRVVREHDLLARATAAAWGRDEGLRRASRPTPPARSRDARSGAAAWPTTTRCGTSWPRPRPAARALAEMPAEDRERVEARCGRLVRRVGRGAARYLEVVAEVPAV